MRLMFYLAFWLCGSIQREVKKELKAKVLFVFVEKESSQLNINPDIFILIKQSPYGLFFN